VENSGIIYLQLLERLRTALPDVAAQIDEEVARGRRVVAETLPHSERQDRNLKMRDAGSRMSKEDLATVPYTEDDRLGLLIDALMRLASSMATSREAVAELLRENERPTTVRFVPEEEVSSVSEIDLVADAPLSSTLHTVLSDLREALTEVR
jgi:hypothetical protein